MPRISVVIPTHNSAAYIRATLQSVLEQQFRELEVLVVDDGSTDETASIVKDLGSDRLRYLQLEHFGGPSRPRNVGVREARGEFVSLFDSDDLMLPDKLARSVALFERAPDLGLVFTNFSSINEQGQALAERYLERYEHFQTLPREPLDDLGHRIRSADAYAGLFHAHYVGTSSALLPRRVLQEVGPFDESLTNGDDRDMWFRIARRYDLGYVDCVGHRYRVRSSSITGRGYRLAENRIAVLAKQLEQADLPGELRKLARRRIAENHYGIGYHFQAAGKLGQARRHYRASLRSQINYPSARGWLITLLGARALAALTRRREPGP